MRIKLLYERLGSFIPGQSLTSPRIAGQDDSPMSGAFEAPERPKSFSSFVVVLVLESAGMDADIFALLLCRQVSEDFN